MLILAVDSSGKSGGLALVRFASGRSLTLEAVPLAGGTFSAQLVPQITGLLSRNDLTKADIEGFAVVSGPGSFTGLRVGLAAVKALAEVLDRPIASISLLEAMAQLAETQGSVVTAIDAGRQEIYAGFYEVRQAEELCLGEQLLSLEELASRAAGHSIVTGDGELAERLRERGLSASVIAHPGADVIARLGFDKIQAGEIVTPEALDATYPRPSDEEIKKPVRTLR